MPHRIALLGILVEDLSSADAINAILHDYAPYIIGRMGIPHRERGVSIISVVLDAPAPAIAALAGKIGMLPGVSSKTIMTKSGQEERKEDHV